MSDTSLPYIVCRHGLTACPTCYQEASDRIISQRDFVMRMREVEGLQGTSPEEIERISKEILKMASDALGKPTVTDNGDGTFAWTWRLGNVSESEASE